jgi:hypothetical protein
MSTLLPISIQQPFVFFPGNDVPVMWAIVFGATSEPITDAVGTLTILDPTDNPVPGASSLPMTPTTTPGTYLATIVGTEFNPAPGTRYVTVVTLTSASANGTGEWQIPTVIRPRTTP